MCNCNSSFCAVCCRRVKAYRFDNVPEITGDLQLYTEFYKVGEAYGHWKFTIDDLEAYLDIPTVLWQDKLVAFGHTATGGLFYDADFMWDYTTSSLGINHTGGSISPTSAIHVFSDLPANAAFELFTASGSSATQRGLFNIQKSRGTIASPTALVNGDKIGSFGFIGYDGSNNQSGALLEAFVDGAVSSGLVPKRLSFVTGSSSGTRAERMVIKSDGKVGVGTTSPNTMLHVTGIVTIDNVVNNNSEDQLLVWNTTTKEVEYRDVSSLPGGGGGTVTSVGMTITGSTALAVSGSPITTSGTFAVTWTGNNTQYVAGDGSLITFPTLTSGTVTAVNSGAGMDFTNFTTSGTIILGTPSTITLASVNGASGTTHSHEFDLGGTAGQYLAGDNTLQTFPTIIDPTGKYVALSDSDAAYSSSTASATSTFRKNSELYGNGVTGAPSAGGYGHLKTFGASAGAYAWQIWKGVYDGDDLYFRSDGGGGYGSWIHIASTTYADNAANGRYVALNDTDAAYSGSVTDANSHTKNSELYGGGATNTPLSGYGFLKTHGASGGSFSWQEYKEVYDGDNRFFRGNASSTWTGSTWYQYASRQWVTAQGYTTNTGTVTAVNSGAGMDFTNFTTSGTIILGTPSSITLSSTNAAIGTTHSHALNLGGTSGQYLAGDNTLQTFPTIPTVTPSALTRTNDTNILLNLTGSNTTALLQAVDIEVAWSGLLSYTRGGTGLGSLGTANQILRVNAWATALEYFTPTWTSNTGTVTNFSANDLTTFTDPLFTVNVTNSTTTPDLTFTLPTLTQKLVFAAPWGVSGQPFWRQLLPSDLQADGATSGQVITWNGTAWVPQNAAGGGVTSVSAGNGMNFTTITTTGAVTMGTPSSITLSSTNGFPSATTHTHAFTPGGSATTQYVTGLGTLATNLWTDFGTFLQPTGGNNIRTNNTAGQGWVHLLVGDATHTGRMEFYNHSAAQIGFIGYYEDRLCYFAGIGYHSFEQLPVRIQSVATDNLLTDFAVYGTGNELKKRTFASLGIIANGPVWYVQGGTTEATTNTQDIYHNGKLKLGTSTSSAYQLAVSGTGYFTSTVDFNNNVGVRGFTTGAVIKNLIRLDGSNRVDIGVSGTDIILPAYLDSRNDSSVPANFIYTTSAGVTQSRSIQAVGNQYATVYRTNSSLGITSGGAATQLTTPTGSETSFISLYSISSNNIVLPNGAQHHKIVVTYDWVTASGTAANTDIETTLDTTTGGAWTGPKWRQNYSGIRGTITVHWSGQVPAGAGQLRAFAQVLSGGNINVFNVRITCDLVGTNT